MKGEAVSYSVTITGHTDSADAEANVVAALREAMPAVKENSTGGVYARVSTQYQGQVDLMEDTGDTTEG